MSHTEPSIDQTASETLQPTQLHERVVSIDALRGFDMFWIIGGSSIATQWLAGSDPDSFAGQLALQFKHVSWEGFRFYDLIFPLFLFLVGCVLPYSLGRYADTPRAVYGRIFRRGGLLILLGFLYNDVLQFDFANMRYMHVLQRIGIGYMAAALIYLHTQWRSQVVITAIILLGYWATGRSSRSSESPADQRATTQSKVTWADTLIATFCQERSWRSIMATVTTKGSCRQFRPSRPRCWVC